LKALFAYETIKKNEVGSKRDGQIRVKVIQLSIGISNEE
jgi:hypothetical protein